MEVNKNPAEVNRQYPMVHKYQAEANNRGHWWIHKCPRMQVNKNQAEVNWQYPMVHR